MPFQVNRVRLHVNRLSKNLTKLADRLQVRQAAVQQQRAAQPRSIAELSHAVAALLKPETEINEANRFASMDLCGELMDQGDRVRDQLMRETLHSWVGKLQAKFQDGSPKSAESATQRFASVADVTAAGFSRVASGMYRQGHEIWELRAADEGGYQLIRKREERAVDLRTAAAPAVTTGSESATRTAQRERPTTRTAAPQLFYVVRVNGDPKDTHAALSLDEAIELANADDGDVLEYTTVSAVDAGLARITPRPGTPWQPVARPKQAQRLEDIFPQVDGGFRYVFSCGARGMLAIDESVDGNAELVHLSGSCTTRDEAQVWKSFKEMKADELAERRFESSLRPGQRVVVARKDGSVAEGTVVRALALGDLLADFGEGEEHVDFDAILEPEIEGCPSCGCPDCFCIALEPEGEDGEDGEDEGEDE